jgi:polysaccharide export outer membrane protein
MTKEPHRPMRRSTWILCTLTVLGLCSAFACKTQHPFVWATELPDQAVSLDEMPLRTGDVIAISVTGMEEELAKAGDMTVTADGKVVVPFIGPMRVEGSTPPAVAQALNARLKGIVQTPDARVTVVRPRVPMVSVVGEVNSPDRFEFESGEGILVALARAGGLTEFADLDDIYVVRKYPKPVRIRFRYEDLVGGVEKVVGFQLRDGDIVVVE